MAGLHWGPSAGTRRVLPKSEGLPDEPHLTDDLTPGPGKPFPKYAGAVWRRDSLDAREEAPKVLLWEWEVGLHTLTRTSVVDRDTEEPWPKSACRSDILNFTGTFDPGLGQTFLSPY